MYHYKQSPEATEYVVAISTYIGIARQPYFIQRTNVVTYSMHTQLT